MHQILDANVEGVVVGKQHQRMFFFLKLQQDASKRSQSLQKATCPLLFKVIVHKEGD